MEVAPKDNFNEFNDNNKNSFSQLKFSYQIKNEISSYMPGQFYNPSFLQQKIENNIKEKKIKIQKKLLLQIKMKLMRLKIFLQMKLII